MYTFLPLNYRFETKRDIRRDSQTNANSVAISFDHRGRHSNFLYRIRSLDCGDMDSFLVRQVSEMVLRIYVVVLLLLYYHHS